jgi:hypothetical protein
VTAAHRSAQESGSRKLRELALERAERRACVASDFPHVEALVRMTKQPTQNAAASPAEQNDANFVGLA